MNGERSPRLDGFLAVCMRLGADPLQIAVAPSPVPVDRLPWVGARPPWPPLRSSRSSRRQRRRDPDHFQRLVAASNPWRKSPLHSSGDASRLTALFVGCICPICAILTPCQAGASPLSVQRGVSPRAASRRPSPVSERPRLGAAVCNGGGPLSSHLTSHADDPVSCRVRSDCRSPQGVPCRNAR